MSRNLTLRYSIFSFLMYGIFCLNSNFLPLYFEHLQFSNFQISLVLFISHIFFLLSSLIVSKLSEKYSAIKISKIAAICSFLILPLMFTFKSFIVMCFIQPARYFLFRANYLVESQSMLDLNNQSFNFSKVRSIGSIGYIAMALGAGLIYDYFHISGIIITIYLCTFLYMIYGSKLSNQIATVPKSSSDSTVFKTISPILIFYLFSWASLSPGMMYSSIYLKDIGFSGSELGFSLFIAVTTEIIFMLYFEKIQRIFSLRTLLLSTVIGGSLRWMVLLITPDKTLIFASQLLHIFNFAIPYLAGIYYLRIKLPAVDFYKGQAFMNTALSAGYLLGQLVCVLYSTQIHTSGELVSSFWISILFNAICFIFLLSISDKLKNLNITEPAPL